MLRPDNLEALLAVCMVKTGFEVFAYCSEFHSLRAAIRASGA